MRTATKPWSDRIAAYLLLAPAVSMNAPVNRKRNPNSKIKVDIPKIAWLLLLNAIGVRRFNGRVVLRNEWPEERKHGTETLELSFRPAFSRMLGSNYERALRAITKPSLVASRRSR